jgi:hypothetical protein
VADIALKAAANSVGRGGRSGPIGEIPLLLDHFIRQQLHLIGND